MLYSESGVETPKVLNAMLGILGVRPSFLHAGVVVLGAGMVCHEAVTHLLLYPVFRLLFGTLYPAYASYKAVRTKNVKEYVKWMMYWIVFALFTCIETFTDVFLSWFPFYYEIKIVLVIWLLSPATKGSSILYRKFVHPMLSSREQEIDEYITKAKEQSYRQVLDLGTKGMSALMQTAIKSITHLPAAITPSHSDPAISSNLLRDLPDSSGGVKRSVTADNMQMYAASAYSDDEEFLEVSPANQLPASELTPPTVKVGKRGVGRPKGAGSKRTTRKSTKEGGGGIVNQLKKSYSLSDLTEDVRRDEVDVVITDPRLVRRRRSPHLSSSSTSAIYFSEVDVRTDRIASIKSAEDISSGYSSGEGLYTGQPLKLMAREGLQRTGSLTRSRTSRVTRSTVVKKSGGSDDSDENEVFDTNIVFFNDKAKQIDRLAEEPLESSSSEAEFLDSLDTLHDYKKIGEDLSNFNTNIDNTSLLTACVDIQPKLDTVNSILTNSSMPSYSNSSIEDTQANSDRLNLMNITKDVASFTSFVKNLIEGKAEKQEAIKDKEQLPSNTTSKDTKKSFKDDKVSDIALHDEPPVRIDGRGGRYNKKAAPPPPPPPRADLGTAEQTTNPIKATLILKPGVVKSIGPKESPCKEIFVHSPKSKRKTLVNRSPSSVSTSSSNSLRSRHSFSKLMKLPRKIGFWNKDELSAPKSAEKRASWHSYVYDSLKPLSDSKMQSKSDNDLAQNKNVVVASLHGPSMYKSGSQLSVKSLTDSPLAHRRLKIIRRYVDEDID